MSSTANETQNPWPHRLAVLLACATFPVIWVGGLVTTYDAGMAFPDWPTSFGYNVFLYPWQTWLSGPWDMFIEHGHRLLVAGIIGPVMLAEAIVVYFTEGRRGVRLLTWAAASLVVFQAVLGGFRVRLDERLLAQIHACVGPAFFALAAALATVTSRRWSFGYQASNAPEAKSLSENRPEAAAAHSWHGLPGRFLPRTAWRAVPQLSSRIGSKANDVEPTLVGKGRIAPLATIVAALAYLQLILGSQLRHLPVTADVVVFRLAVWFHLLVAAVLAAHVVMLWWRVGKTAAGGDGLRRPMNLLLVLIGLQIALGCATWVANYGWPAWMSGLSIAAGYVVHRESFAQATVTTGHVAIGSLILAVSVVLALRSWRTAAVSSGCQTIRCPASQAERRASLTGHILKREAIA